MRQGGGKDPQAGAHGGSSAVFRWGWSVDEGDSGLVDVSCLVRGSVGVPWGLQVVRDSGRVPGEEGDLVGKVEGMGFPSPGALGWRCGDA